jgi:hypothetical protein
VVGQFLATRNDSRLVESRKPHCLRLVEFGVLECPKPKQPVEHRGRKILLFDIQKVGANNSDLHRKGAWYRTLCSLSGWWQCPRVLLLIFRGAGSHSDKVPTSLSFQNDGLSSRRGYPLHACQKRPLVTIWTKFRIYEDAVSICARKLLQRQSDQVAKSALWHGVLVGKEAVV